MHRPYQYPQPTRPVAMGVNGMVSAAHPLGVDGGPARPHGRRQRLRRRRRHRGCAERRRALHVGHGRHRRGARLRRQRRQSARPGLLRPRPAGGPSRSVQRGDDGDRHPGGDGAGQRRGLADAARDLRQVGPPTSLSARHRLRRERISDHLSEQRQDRRGGRQAEKVPGLRRDHARRRRAGASAGDAPQDGPARGLLSRRGHRRQGRLLSRRPRPAHRGGQQRHGRNLRPRRLLDLRGPLGRPDRRPIPRVRRLHRAAQLQRLPGASDPQAPRDLRARRAVVPASRHPPRDDRGGQAVDDRPRALRRRSGPRRYPSRWPAVRQLRDGAAQAYRRGERVVPAMGAVHGRRARGLAGRRGTSRPTAAA